ncbi:MAG: hypothetical protein AAGL98_14530, partial [Planctomycetota bacterium]
MTGYQMRQDAGSAAAGTLPRDLVAQSASRAHPAGPFWSWERFGQTRTVLDDGRIVCVGGEHEDWYDPDFCIYNDVVVLHPDGRHDIYIYSPNVFPPTDFHSATRIGDRIIIIGCLGYVDLRQPGHTPVFELDIETFAITPLTTTGVQPGWLHRHSVEKLEDDRLLVLGGRV